MWKKGMEKRGLGVGVGGGSSGEADSGRVF